MSERFNMAERCPITGLPEDVRSERAFWAHGFALECRRKLGGKRVDNKTQEVYDWIDGTVIPALLASDNEFIQQAVAYFGDRSYRRKHLLYLWHLLQEDKERATQDPFVTVDVFRHLMSGNLGYLTISYQEVMKMYGLED